MANQEQLSILKQGVDVWNRWRADNHNAVIDLSDSNLRNADLRKANLSAANLTGTNFREAKLMEAELGVSNLRAADLSGVDLSGGGLIAANLSLATLMRSNFLNVTIGNTIFGCLDLSHVLGLETVFHGAPSTIGIDTIQQSRGQIPETFLRGCGLSDWEVEQAKLYNPDLSNEEIVQIQYKIYELRATRALQISPLFISYSHADSLFVDKVGEYFTKQGVRYWRDVHEMKAGRVEKQIDRAIRQNPTLLLILSEHSLSSDWVEHEVRTARDVERGMGRDVLCPIALDDSWKSSRWPARLMEQIKEYNILDFSEWQDDSKFDSMFRKLIDGLELFYKG